MMTNRQRILSVYEGQTPDRVPFMLDLSHWFLHKHKLPWDLSCNSSEVLHELIEFHRKHDVGFYLAVNAAFIKTSFSDDIKVTVTKSGNPIEITWLYETPLGTITRRRLWEESSYSWAISDWGIKSENDLKIFKYIFSNIKFALNCELYEAWKAAVGDTGVVYNQLPYSGMGMLLNYWMGVESTILGCYDWPDTMKEVIDSYNENLLNCVDVLCKSSAEIIIMGDNFSSDIQSPAFFEQWSKRFYDEAIRRLHAAGKYTAVHIDGMLKGAISMIRNCGADAADAVTPAPMGDLTPLQCRQEAGNDYILSGGPAPNLWLEDTSVEKFKTAAREWIDLKNYSPRLIANAGDQVPPNASEKRIAIYRDMIERYGWYC